MRNRNSINNVQKKGLINFKSSAKQLLNPILKNPKYIIYYEIIKNWENIVSNKYKHYCILEMVTMSSDKKQANILVKSYNSSTSFFLNNNNQYIIDKINSIFGYNIISKFLIKEVPILIEPKLQKPKVNMKNDNSTKKLDIIVSNSDLKKYLSELAIYIS